MKGIFPNVANGLGRFQGFLFMRFTGGNAFHDVARVRDMKRTAPQRI